MNIPEASEILKEIQIDFANQFTADDLNSIQLGIEALKAWYSSRHFSSIHNFPLLPGETED